MGEAFARAGRLAPRSFADPACWQTPEWHLFIRCVFIAVERDHQVFDVAFSCSELAFPQSTLAATIRPIAHEKGLLNRRGDCRISRHLSRLPNSVESRGWDNGRHDIEDVMTI
jgi:hypothetical protein